jgi:biofilm PGA synthesis N-glycosyltransferase PgaC
LVECFGDPSVGVVSGDLVIRKPGSTEQANIGLYWRYEKWIRDRLSAIDSIMGATGCIYAMRRRLAVPLPPGTLLDDVYLPLAAFFRGYRVIVERAAKAYDEPTDLGPEFLRKVRTLAGVYQIVRAYPALLSPAHRMWLYFGSHKIGRLLLPHAMIVMAVSSFVLSGVWSGVALGAQAGFYLCSGVDIWIPERWLLKPVTSAARTFVVLMAAAFCAVPSFLFGGLDLWRETRVPATVRRVEAHVK